MTPEAELQIAAIAEQTGLKPADIQALGDPNATEDDLVLLFQTYKNAGAIASVSTFDQIMDVLAIVSKITGEVVPAIGLANSLRTLFAGV